MSENKNVIVIGGGITGLTAAWRLKQLDPRLNVTVLEKEDCWGGKVHTVVLPGPEGGEFLIDAGAESFVTRKVEIWALALELGLADKVKDPGSETRNIYVLDNGKPVKVPLDPISFFTTRLMSARGKLRMLLEPFQPARRDGQDESLASFADRRLGREAREKFIGPILGGIYNANPETQSIMTTSPIMREMEADGGSLVGAMLKRMVSARKTKPEADDGQPKRPRFLTFDVGAQRIIDALVEKTEAEFISEADVQAIAARGEEYSVRLADGREFEADAVILAVPANAASGMLMLVAPDMIDKLAVIRHEHIGTLTLGYKEAELPAGMDMNGLMIPRREQRTIDAVTLTTAKMPERAPEGYAMLRVFFGGGCPEVADLPEDELIKVVCAELKALLGIEAMPAVTYVKRWLKSYPQADVGHLGLVDEIDSLAPPGILVTGSSYRGIGVPDCVRQGNEAARAVVEYFK